MPASSSRGPVRSAFRLAALGAGIAALVAGASGSWTTAAGAASPTGLVAAYSFDAGSGSTVADLSGNGNSGSLSNATWSPAGKYGGALAFNGGSSMVTVADAPELDLTTGMTLEAWVDPANLGTSWRTAILKEQSPPSELTYALYANTDAGQPATNAFVGGDTFIQGGSIPLNNWSFLASTYDGSTLRLYLNGNQIASRSLNGSMLTSSGPLRIGGNQVWGEWFNGLIDNIRIYNQALTASQIQTDMNTPVGTSSAPPPPPPGGDTQPPSTPTGLAATGATQSSISTSWQASSDNVGVAGYDVFVNGSKVGTATGTSFTFTGLACGTQYTLAVDAFDGAGNRSGQTSVIAATSACSTGTANVFVSPSGSDSNACTQSAPCRSFQRAYQDAQPGDVVQVAGGTYSDTDLNLDSSKTSSTDVIFQPAAGATVRLSNRLTIRARHLEIRNMTMEYTLWATAADVTMRNIRVPGTWTIFSDGSQAPTDISIIGGDVGPSADSNDIIGANGPAATVSPRNILIDGVSFHDFTLSPGSSAHVECLQVWAVNGLTINHSKFRNCFVFDIFLQHFPGGSVPSPSNVTIENSFFDCCGTGGDFQPAIRYGDHPGEPFSNVLIAYNSLNKDINLANATGVTYQNVRIIANIGPRLDTEGPVPPGVTSDYNVWFSGSRIGSHDQVAPSGFRDPANFDFHLVSGAAAINHGDPTNFPPNDIDGDPRPLGAGVDAGADEVP